MNNSKQNVRTVFFNKGKLLLLPKDEARKMLAIEIVRDIVLIKGQVFTEVELNEILKNVYDDYATLRRALIDYKFVVRTKEGTRYRVVYK